MQKEQEDKDRSRLAKVEVLGVLNPFSHDTTRFRLNDYVVLTVKDLRLALRRSKHSAKDLRLFVSDVMLPMLPVAMDTTNRRDIATVQFRLVRDETTEPTWQRLYKVPGTYSHKGQFNIGFETGQLGLPYPKGDHPPVDQLLDLELIQKDWFWVGVGLFALLLGSMYWLADRSNLIRSDRSNVVRPVAEPNAPPGQIPQVPVISLAYKLVPFSLAKSQVAYWTLLVAGAYLMIFFVTSALPTIPSGLLGLLGISIANGLFSKLINKTQTPAEIDAAANLRQTDGIGKSRGWVSDVLTDTNGVSIVRLQFVVFNAVVGIYVVQQVLTHWSLPNLDGNILALISISSLGFLVQKNSEGRTDKPNSDPPPPPAVQVNMPPAGPPPGGGGVAVTVQHSLPGGVVNVLNVGTPPDKPADAPAAAPAATPAVLPDGTPIRRADEDDNSASASVAALTAEPGTSLGMG